jgi:hypothetical protein
MCRDGTQRDPLQQQVEPEHAGRAAGVDPAFENFGHRRCYFGGAVK